MTLAIEQDAFAPIDNVVKKAIKQVAPKFDNIQMVDVLYVEGGRWHTIELTWHEYIAALQNGTVMDGVESCKLAAICVNEVNIDLEDGSTEKIRMVYDFVLKHTERDPWRMS